MRKDWMRYKFSTAGAWILGLCLLSSCQVFFGTEEEADPDLALIAARLHECEVNLAAGNYERARNPAELVINTPRLASKDSVLVDRARFCYTSSNSLFQLNEVTKQLKALLTPLLGLFNGEIKFSPQEIRQLAMDYRDGKLDPAMASPISLLISAFTGPIQSTLKENIEQMEEIIKHDRFTWSIVHMPVKIGESDLIDVGGEYDMGEIYFLYGVSRAILSTFYLAGSQDYSINLGATANYLINTEGNPVVKLGEAPGKAIVNLLAFIMGTGKSFLALDATSGPSYMKEAGEGYSAGFDGIIKGVDFMRDERKGKQSKHIFEYKRIDDEDFLILHINFVANPLPIFDLEKFNGLAIPLRSDIHEGLEHMRDDFAGQPGINTNLQRDIFPLLAIVTAVLVNSGAFDALINVALESSDPKTQALAKQVLKLLGDNQDLLLGALLGLVPVEIEFDFGTVFAKPGGLRDIFPAWTEPADPSDLDNWVDAMVVYSYECSDAIKDPLRHETYICEEVTTESDADHFVYASPVTAYEMWDPLTSSFVPSALTNWENNESNNFGPHWSPPLAADGISTIIPYIGFKDATFGGLLLLDITAIQTPKLVPPGGGGLRPATLQTLNATLASVVASVQGILK